MNTSAYCFISLYQSYPSYHGASDVSYNLFKSWPNLNKRLIQITNSKNNKKHIYNIKKKATPIGTLVNIFCILYKVKNYLKKFDKKIIVVEGASWAGYTFLIIILSKIFIRNISIIYHAHNLEYEVRKLKNNFLIAWLTFYFEKYIYQNCIGTSVSKKDQNFVSKIYNSKSILFENGVLKTKSIRPSQINLKKKYILFCGSYTYWPNKIAIDKILNEKKSIDKIYPKIKYVFTGEGLPSNKDQNILNLGIVSKSKLVWLIKNCFFFYAPMPKAPGTKIKIIEAIFYGATVVCSRHAVIGLEKYKKLNSLLITSKKNLEKNIRKVKKINKTNRIKKKNLILFKKYYEFGQKTKDLYEKINKQ